MARKRKIEREKLFTVRAKDCKWHYFGASSKGGQNANRNKNYCRCIHPPSGAVGLGRVFKSQKQNKRLAFQNMAKSKKFMDWAHLQGLKQIGWMDQKKTEITRSLANPKETRVEVVEDDKWVIQFF